MDHVLYLIKKLNQVVSNAINGVISKLQGLKDKIIQLQKDAVHLAQIQINKIVDGVLAHLEKLKEDAAALDVDISECVDENEKDIKLLAGTIFLDTASCITRNTFKAFKILEDAMDATKDIMKDVNDLEDDYQKCQSAFCYIKMSYEVSKLLVSLPLRGTKLFLRAQQTLILIQLEITACVGDKIMALQDDLEPTLDAVNKCIADKIGEPDSKRYYY